MQNKGAIRLFAILLALVSAYQLIFTFKTKSVESDAEAFAKGNPMAKFAYLDSIANEEVLFGHYTYKECKTKEINFGLDLKGGMNLILEVKVADILKALSNYSTDETFLAAVKNAEVREKNSSDNFIDLFGEEFGKLDKNASLAAIFSTVELKGMVSFNSTNDEVLAVLKTECEGAISNAFNILRTRIDRFGVTQPNIQELEKAGRILVELPGVTDPQRVRKLLQGTANLEFWETYNNSDVFNFLVEADAKIREIESAKKASVSETVVAEAVAEAPVESKDELDLLATMESDSLKTDSLSTEAIISLFTYLNPSPNANGPVIGTVLGKDTSKVFSYLAMPQIKALLPGDLKVALSVEPLDVKKAKLYTNKQISDKDELYQLVAIKVSSLDGRPPLDGGVITNARKELDPAGNFEVNMTMNSEGAKTWARLTKANIGNSIAIVLDGYVRSFPTVNDEIKGGRSSISGDFTAEEAEDLANILKSGKLPAPARIVEDTVVGPSLGKEAVDSGLSSFMWAFIVVLIYMLIYYGARAGIIADFALIANMFFIVGVLASFGAVLTLPGIAGIVLTIGMSVDANVLIYERIRDELRSGKGISAAIADGYRNAFSAIIDANVTTFLTGLILFLFGTGPIKGFATTLMIGIATSFLSAVFITRLIFEGFLAKNMKIKFGTKLTENLFQNSNVAFIAKKNIAFVVSGIVILISVISLSTQSLKFGIDFTGGRTYVVRFDDVVSSTDVQKKLVAEFEGATCEVKTFGEENQVRIATNYLIDINDEDTEEIIEGKLYTALQSFVGEEVTKEVFLSDYRMSSQKVGPTIASDIKRNAYLSILFSLIVIFLYIWMRFRNLEYSIGAVVALLHDVIVVLGVFSLFYAFMPFSMEIDQAFIAAILTVIGYSINDTVVVFDRIREFFHLYPKRDKEDVMNSALNSTISRTLNTSLTTFVVLLVIFIFGGEVIRGFVFALMIGVVVGTYSSLFVATPIAQSIIAKRDAKKGLKK